MALTLLTSKYSYINKITFSVMSVLKIPNNGFLNRKSKFPKTETNTVHIICKKCEVDKIKQHCTINDKSLCSPYNCILKKHLDVFTELEETVVSLTLCGCNLSELPKCLSKFNIKELNLSRNKFVEVPETLSNCRKLEKLDLSWNKIQKFDIEPAFIQRLRHLNLEHNAMTNIPEWILNVRSFNLEELYYSYNKVEDFSNANFHKVSHYELKRLEMQNCYLIDSDMKFLKSIRTLTNLNISNDKDRNNLNIFAKCDALFDKPLWYNTITVLKLNGLQLSMIPPEINSFASLEELEISKNYLMSLPEHLCDLTELKCLDVSNNHLIELPKNFKKLKSLQTLKAAHNHIAALHNLFLLNNLCYLDLYDNDLDIFSELNINSLKYADIEFNYFSSKDVERLNFDDYESRKTALRRLASEYRTDGPKPVSCSTEDYITSSEYSGSDAYSDIDCENDVTYCTSSNNCNYYNELDNWDNKKSVHPDNGCTESDNEWKGCDKSSFRIPNRPKNTKTLKRWPSYLFEDATE